MTTFFAIVLVATLYLTWRFKLWNISSDNLWINILKGVRLLGLAIIIIFSLIAVLVGPQVEKDIAHENKIEQADKQIKLEEKKANAEKKRKEEAVLEKAKVQEEKAKAQDEKVKAELKKTEEAHAKVAADAKLAEQKTTAENATLTVLNSKFGQFGTFAIEERSGYKTFAMTITDSGLVEEVNTVPYNTEAYKAWSNGLVLGFVSLTTGNENIMPPSTYGTYSLQLSHQLNPKTKSLKYRMEMLCMILQVSLNNIKGG